MNLKDVVTTVELEAESIGVDHIESYGFDDYMMSAIRSKPYYRCLPAYIKSFGIKNVLELGTCSGASALAMSTFASKVKTVDITDQFLVSKSVFEGTNVEFLNVEISPLVLEVSTEGFDMIFIDISHSGHEEEALHRKLEKEYNGLVFYDDIFFSEAMLKFWNGIKQDKIETTWHHQFGFGIVRY